MSEVDKMLAWSENLQEEVATLPFHEDDIRRSFFDLIYDIGFNYYRGYMLYDIMSFINNGQVLLDESNKNHTYVRFSNKLLVEIIYKLYYN